MIPVMEENIVVKGGDTVYQLLLLNHVPNNKISALSKLEEFANDNSNVSQTVNLFFDKAENIVRK